MTVRLVVDDVVLLDAVVPVVTGLPNSYIYDNNRNSL
jgi:hypothetical protein